MSDDFSKTDENISKDKNHRYKCRKCNFKCSTHSILKHHLDHEHDTSVSTCNDCGANSNRAIDMEIYMDNHSQENSLFINMDKIVHIPEFILKTNHNGFTHECKQCTRVVCKKINFYNHDCKSNSKNATSVAKRTVRCMTFKFPTKMYDHRKFHN